MYCKVIKRMLAVILSILGIICLSWLFVLIMLAIKLDSRGPVFFKQKRVGIHKTYFEILKFRTMRIDTPKDTPTHLLESPDQYITRVGKFLRRTSLDELPQIFNILKGDMAIIGPRPALWNQFDLIEERDKYGANDVRPGLTGWAQINGRDELEIEEKARLDGYYVQNMGFIFDLKCFFGTIKSVLESDGVVEGGTGTMEKEKKKILLVANVAKEHVIKFHIPTIKMFMENGVIVDVACSGDDKVPYCNKQFKMSYKRSPFNLDIIKGTLELRKIIDEGKYDIIYCHTPVGGFAARIAAIGARKRGTKVVYFAHGYHFFKGAPLKNWLIYYLMEKILSYMTDVIFLANKEDYIITKKRFKNCKAYLTNEIGVDFSRFVIGNKEQIRKEYRKEFDIPEDATVLIYLAELLENKNQTYLMRALKYVLKKDENVYLVLAGFDHSNGEFKKYAEKLGVDSHIRFLGWREDVGNLYTMADICTASSIREGFGLNLAEAMLCDIPVVATKNRGHVTIIRDGENGFLVDLNDEKLFAKRVLQLINHPELREKFVEEGRKSRDKFSSETFLKNIRVVFREIGNI